MCFLSAPDTALLLSFLSCARTGLTPAQPHAWEKNHNAKHPLSPLLPTFKKRRANVARVTQRGCMPGAWKQAQSSSLLAFVQAENQQLCKSTEKREGRKAQPAWGGRWEVEQETLCSLERLQDATAVITSALASPSSWDFDFRFVNTHLLPAVGMSLLFTDYIPIIHSDIRQFQEIYIERNRLL